MGDHQRDVALRDVKSRSPVFPWEMQREPWATIGREFAAECAALASGASSPPPSRRPVKTPPRPNTDLRQMRLQKGLSQTALAKLIGYNQRSVSEVELGVGSRRTLETLIRRALEG